MEAVREMSKARSHEPSSCKLVLSTPYCNQPFRISLRTDKDRLLAIEKAADLEVLPYARDIDVFDPDPREEGKTNSVFTQIGTNFFGGLNYEKIGILHMEPGWDVHYCVARCTKCKMLIDVFVNLTHSKRLAEHVAAPAAQKPIIAAALFHGSRPAVLFHGGRLTLSIVSLANRLWCFCACSCCWLVRLRHS